LPPNADSIPRQTTLYARHCSWGSLVAIAIAAVAFLFVTEWLFFATKPSFLSEMPWSDRVITLGGAPLLPATAMLLALGGLRALAFAAAPKEGLFQRVGLAIVALVLATALFLMVDNFTTTIFGIIARTSQRFLRLGFASLFCLIAVWSYRCVERWSRSIDERLPLPTTAAVIVIPLLAMGGAALAARPWRDRPIHGIALEAPHARRPNILIFGADSVLASHLSLYGYERRTSPNLDLLAAEALVCERAYPNATVTGAATVAILSGKHPFVTGTFEREVLKGIDAYQHLPAILRSIGYRSAQFTVRPHADAFDLNLRSSFDLANSRKPHDVLGGVPAERWVGQYASFLLSLTLERVEQRLGHIFRLPRRVLALLGSGVPESSSGTFRDERDFDLAYDQQTVESLLQWIEGAPEPFFAHAFVLGTHGPTFAIQRQQFSLAHGQRAPSSDDFYDDAILQVDKELGRIVQFLRSKRLLDRTIVVVYSDHDPTREAARRLPLVFRFPEQAYRGRIQESVQHLDVGPTILEYLGLAQPAWMPGHSLISERPLDPCRWITAVKPNAAYYDEHFRLGYSTKARIEGVTVTICDATYRYSIRTGEGYEAHEPSSSCGCAAAPSAVSQYVASQLSRVEGHGGP
jgi:sulfatase-like protein